MSPLGEMKINTLQVQMREKSQLSDWRCGKTGNTSEAWEKENTLQVEGRARNVF